MPTNNATLLHTAHDQKSYELVMGVKTLRNDGNGLRESLINTIFSTQHLLDVANTPIETAATNAAS